MKLQDAYISETGDQVGTWKAIGYTMSGETPAFKYDNDTDIDWDGKQSAEIPNSAAKMWVATARVGLNDCSTGSSWVLWAKRNGTGNGIAWGASIKKGGVSGAATDMDADCDILTPQFKNLRSNADGSL